MGRPWPARLSFFLLSSLVSCVSAGHSFENTAIVRTVELAGSLVHVTTTYAVKALEDDANLYTIALGAREHERASYLEAKIKGQSTRLSLEVSGYNAQSGVHLYDIELPKALNINATTNLVIESIETHATYPWPEQASQKDPQSLKYESDLFVLSPYHTAVQRTKFKSPSPQVLSYTTPQGVEEFTTDAPVTKSGATITYGPYNSISPSSSEEFLNEKQKHVTVHYNFDHPVLEITSLKRAAEVSHWGANLNIEDNIFLHNAGPALKGHFSRLEYQSANFFGRPAPHIIPGLTLHLPAGIRSPYYYDLIGNVSTSHLRTTPSASRSLQGSQFSVLELRPRYPLLGGWNYSFTLGWDSPLADSAGYDARTGKYLVGVPVMTPFPGAVVDDAELKVILPEGATDVEFATPFPPLSSELSTHISYLDTVGRPTVTLRYKNLTGKHTGTVYVSYRVPFAAHLKKPFAVAAAFMGLFLLGFTSKRLDVRLQKK
ncbi:oligosaccharyl transferase alpha subunit [Amylocystis lapponica]|nr:oligosaccharyl transferase alpha subunit [Amylocystis lapponica]